MPPTHPERRRRRPSRGSPPRSPRRPRRPWLAALAFYARHLVLWLLVALAAYWLWLDREVAQTFRDKQWSLPARVYARPLELYPGAAVSHARLARELEYLGYERVATPRRRGQYTLGQASVDLFARGFDFWDMPEPSRAVRVRFADGAVSALTDVSAAAPIDVLRLDPVEIGSINPTRFEDRKLLAFEELPRAFVAALVAVEDRRFLEHHGVDLHGLARAMWANIRARRWVQGGSTLTQQLVKNFYLTSDRTLTRKLIELMMAVSLELRFEKQVILETYVNEVFLGQDGNRAIHGFELAAQFYFGRPLAELDMAETALLIGMIKGPSVYDPRRHAARARARRDVVLDTLAARGILTAAEVEALKARDIVLRGARERRGTANPAFMSLVKRQLLRDYSTADLNEAGLNIFTTLDPEVQRAAEQGVRKALAAIERDGRKRDLQAAAVVVEPASGDILGLIGDREPDFAGFNRALDARRPVGSVLKPFVYALALAQPERYALYTTIDDLAVSWSDTRGQTWEPRNFDGIEHGRVTVLEALTRSLNLATVNLALALDLTRVRDYLLHLGVTGKIPAYPSIVLGAIEMSPLEMAGLYTTLANDGYQPPLRAISDVTTRTQTKLKRYPLELRAAMEPETAALVRHALRRVVEQGTARRVRDYLPATTAVAGKTGTSNDHRDSWFAGFGANRLAVVWVGRDDNGVTGLTGSTGALRVWGEIMRGSELEGLSERLPDGLHWVRMDLERGVAIPETCANGERIPVHRRTIVQHAAHCTPAPPLAPGTGRVFDRLREFFGQ